MHHFSAKFRINNTKMVLTLTIDEVNKLTSDKFIKIFGNVIEHYPSAAIGILKNRPFQSGNELSAAVDYLLDGLNANEKEKILCLHPDLAGKIADAGKLSLESTEEQKSVGLDSLTVEDKAKLASFNEQYTTKFSFPFVICVKQNKFATIMKAIEERLKNDKTQEIATGINEVKKISKIRIKEMIIE